LVKGKLKLIQHLAIFPKDNSLSIFAVIMFHNHIRNGMVWFQYAINTEISNIIFKYDIKFMKIL
jgi:hypothetical protein